MSIKTANFVVVRNNDPFRCKGNELISTLDQRDTLLVSRNDVINRVKLPFNLDTVASVENKSVNLNYKQYAFVRNRDNGQTLDETSPPFASAQQELRVYEHIFDGDENTRFKSYTNSGIRHDLVVQFPEPIDVYSSIRIKAGFHDNARTGQMLINGTVVRELTAWDEKPQVFSADFTGQVSEFSIRQKDNYGTQCTAVLNYIELDGEKLVSIVSGATELTLSSEADMSKYKVNMRIKKYQGNVTGIIGAVDEVNKKITLTGSASFSADDEIIIDQVDGNPIDFPEILDADLFACTDVNNTTYKVTGAQFKALLEPPGPLKIVVPHDTELVSENNWRIKTQATVTGGVTPYVREYSWQGFVRADSQIPVEGTGENRNTDLPLFSRTSGSECIVAFSHTSQKTGAYLYNTVTGFDWNYMEKLPSINMKGGKFHNGKFWGCAAGPLSGVYLISVNSDGSYDMERKDISGIAGGGSVDATAIYNLDFNTETGTVIFVGYRKVYRANYLSDPDLTNIEIISNNAFDYLRPIVCDPDTNEWWMGNNTADAFYSDDDGKTWTKLSFKYGVRNGPIESGDFYIDKDYIYVSITSQKVSGKFLRQGATSADSDNWYYCNTNDKETIIRTAHGDKYYAKGFHDDQSEWYLTYDETVNFADTSKPITLSTPFTNGMWSAVCGEQVIIRGAVTDVVEGETFSVDPNNQSPESIQCTNVVTDKVLADVQVTVPAPL